MYHRIIFTYLVGSVYFLVNALIIIQPKLKGAGLSGPFEISAFPDREHFH
jgi:hypothetical protein